MIVSTNNKGYPGEPYSYDAGTLYALLNGRQTKGPDVMLGDDPHLMASGDFSLQQKEEILIESYNKLKEEYESFRKPKGSRNSPAPICSDIFNNYPHMTSGILKIYQVL